MAHSSRSDAPPPVRYRHLSHAAQQHVVHRVPSILDEGFSEDTQSQLGSDMDMDMSGDIKHGADHVAPAVRDLESLGLDQRLDVLRRGACTLSADDQLALVNSLLGLLPTWAKQRASAHLDSLMFFDPINYLPVELVSMVFDHLSPKDLLGASGVNRLWRLRTQDEELWRHCFKREGWHVDAPKLRHAESVARENSLVSAKDSTRRGGIALQRRDSRKRRAGEAFSDGETSTPQLGKSSMPSVEVSVGTSSGTAVDGAAGTIRASTGYIPGTTVPANNALEPMTARNPSTDSDMSDDSASQDEDRNYKIAPTVFNTNTSQDPKVSWAYLYKQRRLLERNWDEGKYQMFRLPHPQHPEQGHQECVYTIQYTGKYLVSGSRDKTIRIWDLDTCKLREPGKAVLQGHEASVLCLQFDASPENDLIVSGGSDSYVIIWKFSTGEMIKKMTSAHTESVLNLRFDHRYIVTCSKDKSIRIWNRHKIARDSPLVPTFALRKFDDPSMPDLIAEHTLLATLMGHGAAVNAVMIHNDTIVSASGDRTIKAWNINTGRDEKNYIGHTKGIACVQYDGRRIISGSSDNTVRIFDAERQAEVACLHGHSNLVRTVQARFGDLDIATDEELEEEARQADQAFYRAVHNGMTPASASRQGRRNAGSSRPEEMLATGTKIPPGGGGSKWAKIVSGSYDETIIIWKKDKDGKWVHRHRLHQDPLLRNRTANRRHVPTTALPQPTNVASINAQAGPASQPQPPAPLNTLSTPAQQAFSQAQSHVAHASQILNPAPGTGQAHTNAQATAATSQLNAALSQLTSAQNPASTSASAAASAAAPATATATTTTTATHAHPPHHHHHPHQQPNAAAMQAAGSFAPQQHAPHHRDSSNRVFKLQFDARRIVCCSQNKVIVGWDFANGDPELQRVGGWSLETY